MSGQYGLTKEQQETIIKILKEQKVQLIPRDQYKDSGGNRIPFHRDVSIHISSSDDESEEYNMFIQVD